MGKNNTVGSQISCALLFSQNKSFNVNQIYVYLGQLFNLTCIRVFGVVTMPSQVLNPLGLNAFLRKI